MIHYIDINNNDGKIILKLFDGKKYIDYYLCEGNNIDIYVLPEKRCIGHKDLDSLTYYRCPNNTIVNKYNSCYICNKKNEFHKCLSCHGDDCTNSNVNAKKYCENPHYVYIAIYDENKIKVGTCFYKRKKHRLEEQGVLAVLYISKLNNGKQAREIEKLIHTTINIPYQINSTYKIKNIMNVCSKNQCYILLSSLYDSITENLGKRIINIKEFYFFNNVYYSVLSLQKLFKNYKIKWSSDNVHIKGKIVAVRGTLIAVLNENNIIIRDLKKYIGNYLTMEDYKFDM